MFKLSVEGASLQDLQANLLAAASMLGGNIVATSRGTTASQGAGSTDRKSPPAEEPGLDYDTDVKPKIIAFSKKHGREPLMEVLGDFKNPSTGEPCTKGQELNPKDWPKVLTALATKTEELETA